MLQRVPRSAASFVAFDRIAVVVTGTVGDERDERTAGAALGRWTARKSATLVLDRLAKARSSSSQIAPTTSRLFPFFAAADIVGFTDMASLNYIDSGVEWSRRAASRGRWKPSPKRQRFASSA